MIGKDDNVDAVSYFSYDNIKAKGGYEHFDEHHLWIMTEPIINYSFPQQLKKQVRALEKQIADQDRKNIINEKK